MKFNERIRAWRASRPGLTSADLARACGVSRQAAIQWEAGTTTPTIANLERIAAAIGVSLSVFYGHPPTVGTSSPDGKRDVPERTGGVASRRGSRA